MDRIEKLRQKLPADFAAALVMGEVSRYYLLRFDSGDAGILLILPEKNYFIIDSRYTEVAARDVKNAELIRQDGDGMAETIVTLVKNINDGGALMDNTSSMNVDDGVAKIRVPYAKISA